MPQTSDESAVILKRFRKASGRFSAYRRFLLELHPYLNAPIDFESARRIILQRFAERKQRFLRMIKNCVFSNPASPYLPLLHAAGCTYEDIASELAQRDLEVLLRKLRDNGVWISFDEFKGRKPIIRGQQVYHAADANFDNVGLAPSFQAQTGGSSGRPVRVQIDLSYLESRACYEHMVFKQLGLYQIPFAIWYPRFPGSVGLTNLLRYAKIGHPPDRWFDMELDESIFPLWHDWALSGILSFSRLSRTRLPKPEAAAVESREAILSWILDQLSIHGRCVFQSNVSSIMRIAMLAAENNADLTGAQFLAGSEPLTPAKKRLIESVHAEVFVRYFSVDAGSIGIGCAFPQEIDEVHLASDATAIIPLHEQTDPDGSSRFLLTTFLGANPKVMINVELGDQGVITHRACSCIFDELGFHTHLSNIRSITRSTAEGIALPYDYLIRLCEEVLPGRYGGVWSDFQWIEDEDEQQLTRLWLRVAPRLGPIDESELTRFLYSHLAKPSLEQRFYSTCWKKAGTIRVVRENPRILQSGKIPVIIRSKAAGIPINS